MNEDYLQDADAMIRANGEAEALETITLRETAKTYAQQLEKMEALYEKNAAAIEELRRMNEEAAASMRLAAEAAAANDTEKNLSERIRQSDDFSHKENVRVYRNIQASTDQMLQKQLQEIRAEIAPLKEERTPKASPVQILTFIAVLAVAALQILLLLRG
ncbi:MAG: hypothetical protein IJV14_02795 [Lachnospiraceae bacterium]|nr:hypothetical protein [Lachnospiraceae bacterium]